MRSNVLFVFFFVSAWAFSQEKTRMLEGRVTSLDGDVAATHVLNISTKRASITDVNGFFAIPVFLNDTLVFSAVQYKKKTIVVTESIYNSKVLTVPLEPTLNELDEVVVTPYNLTGNIRRDMDRITIAPVVTASTLDLPNAYVKPLSQSQRLLNEATTGGGILPLNPIINGISGRTKMLKKRVERDNLYSRTQRVREFYADSLFQQNFRLPYEKLDDFFYFCEVDSGFQEVVDTHDRIKIWEFLRKKSQVYRKNNNLE
jgi:hypothetical protein